MVQWMQAKDMPQEACIVQFQCVFTLSSPMELTFRYSADETVQLYLDGQYLADGPELGALEYWYCAYAHAVLQAGTHTLDARLCWFPGPWNRRFMSIRPGFYCEDGDGVLVNWRCRVEQGLSFTPPFPDWGCAPRIHVGAEYGNGDWEPVVTFEDTRVLHEPELPAMRREAVVPQALRDGVLYFPEYGCRWTIWHWKGKGKVKVRWSETPYYSETIEIPSLKGDKRNRDGKYFYGVWDEFDVERDYDWRDITWRAGHYVEIQTEGDVRWTAEFFNTGYPLPPYQGDSPLVKAAIETLRACAHDTFMDCPYYERLLYAGDFRLEALTLYSLTDDHRLPAKCLRMLFSSRKEDGFLYTQYPSRSKQIIASFIPILMLAFHDYWERHGTQDRTIQDLLPRFSHLADELAACISDDGVSIPSWNFLDWNDAWKQGVPPGNAALSLLAVLALRAAADIVPQSNWRQRADELADWCGKTFYVPEEGLFYDDKEHTALSEHTLSLATLAGWHDLRLDPQGAVPCSISFSYYYLSACRLAGRKDLIRKRLACWEETLSHGLTTLPEEFDNPRSDCHAWGAYVITFLDD